MNLYTAGSEITNFGELDAARYVFGKEIKRDFIPYENEEPFNLPTQSPVIYLFDSEPSIADALSGIGALVGYTLTSWIESQSKPFTRSYTFPAINSTDNDKRRGQLSACFAG